MPKSKHRRKNKNRPRPRNVAPQKVNPPPSPDWIPKVGTGLLLLGVLIILLGYLDPVQEMTTGWPGLRSNWPLVGGLVVLSTGFGFLTRWR